MSCSTCWNLSSSGFPDFQSFSKIQATAFDKMLKLLCKHRFDRKTFISMALEAMLTSTKIGRTNNQLQSILPI